MKNIFVLILSLLLTVNAFGQGRPFNVKLYPDGPAESNGFEGKEIIKNDLRIYYVAEARMDVYLPENPNGQAVIICPGGGYTLLAHFGEGHMVAEWLNRRGIAAIVLYYRMPNLHSNIPITDVRTAIATVRTNAAEWKINPNEVGIMGFSAGGHLAATSMTKIVSAETRPDFGILVYPVISLDKFPHSGTRRQLIGRDCPQKVAEEWSLENFVSEQTPTAFIALSDDDNAVSPLNSIMFYQQLKKYHIPAEMHIYPTGEHGWGFEATRMKDFGEFETSLERWLQDLHNQALAPNAK